MGYADQVAAEAAEMELRRKAAEQEAIAARGVSGGEEADTQLASYQPPPRTTPAVGPDWSESIRQLHNAHLLDEGSLADKEGQGELVKRQRAAVDEATKLGELRLKQLHEDRALAAHHAGQGFGGRMLEYFTPRMHTVPVAPEAPPTTETERAKIREGVELRGMAPEDAAKFAAGLLADKDVPPIRDYATPPPGTTSATPAEAPAAPAAATPGATKGTFVDDAKAKPATAGAAGAGSSGSGVRGLNSVAESVGLEGAPQGGDWDAPYLTEAAAASAQAQGEGELAKIEANKAAHEAAIGEKAKSDLDQLNAEYQAKSQQHLNHIAEMTKEVAEQRIDPERWWKTQGLGNQIRYTLATALGGFGAALTHSQNVALELMKSHIDNDIDAQKENILNKHRSIETERGLLGEAYKRTHNMQEAVLLAKDLAYGNVAAQAKSLSAGPLDTIANAKANHAIAIIDEWRQEHREHAAEFYQSELEKLMLRRMKLGAGGGGVNEKELKAIGEDYEKHNIEPAEEAIQRALADINSKDPAGISRAKMALGEKFPGLASMVLTQEGLNNQADLRGATEQITKVLGKLSPSTAKIIERNMGSGSPEGVRHGLEMAAAMLDQHRANIDSKYPAAVVTEHYRRLGRNPNGDRPMAPPTSTVPLMPLTGGK